MKKSFLSFTCSFLLFSGCAATQKVLETKDSMMSPVDKGVVVVEEGYENVTNFFAKVGDSLSEGTDSLTSNLVDNSFSQLFLNDEYILKHRNSLIIWNKGNNNSVNIILKNYIKKKNLKINYKNLLTKDKLKLLNDYYFEMAQVTFKKELNRQIKRPNFDSYLSNRENISQFDAYNLKILKANNAWNRDINKTKKIVLEKSLATLYGNPKLKVRNYNPFLGRLYITINSKKNNFKQKAFIKVDKETAKILEKKKSTPFVYYKLSDDSFELYGASIKINNKAYLIHLSDETYIKENKITLNHKSLNLQKETITYNEQAKDVVPPEWYFYLKEEDKVIIGYGQAFDEKDAKNNALQNISERISVKVKSESTFEKEMSGDIVSKKSKKKINIISDNKKLIGAKQIKSEKKNGLWFVAVKYNKK